MFNKLYVAIKKYLKENYKFLILVLIMFFVLTWKLPFYILTPGGTIDLEDRIEISNSQKLDGSFNLVYVSQLNGTIPTYLLSLVFDNWDIVKHDDMKEENESIDDLTTRSRLMLKSSLNSAVLVAYKNAYRNYEVKDINYVVIYVDKKADTDIKIGDEIISINGKKIESMNFIKEVISKLKVGEEVSVRVKNGNDEKDKKAKIYEEDGQKYIGIMFLKDFEVDTEEDIKFKFKDSELGSSGGLMTTLDIYSKLAKEDLTHGMKIAGTGTIDAEGNVGSIDGIKYKILGSIKKKVDIFLVPNGENYEDAKKVLKDKKTDMKLVPVKTFTEAKEYLEGL